MACRITLDIPEFRGTYQQYQCVKEFPDAYLNTLSGVALQIFNVNPNCYGWNFNQIVLQLMTAHVALLFGNANNGQITGVITGATIDKVNVTLQPPPEKSQWQWWLNQTPYGQALLAMFQAQTVGGFYAGGSLDLASFRRAPRLWPQ